MSSCCYCCCGVVTQAYGQPDNPVSHWVKMEKPAILTAAPFRGLPQPEAHYRSGFNANLVGNGSA
ncbi:hypothetical protein E5103_15615 [Salmonella enterica subsp. enterica serovar Florida]|nr:hypothetical protein [Salmonella enterica]ECC9936346.1 hypothetical protein [Salmonella enterica subsp. enterica]ECD7242858.1 hypothetical protein [Salmonella enterica subsp. enterica serovar Florida]ECE2928296.1 hypothetical protein [Salmonella enterica]ECF4165890.1 hypothetical protein [Salmonella enterica subsp. enterica serovar Florida]